MMKIKATPIGSAIPTLSERDPKVETDTDFEIALSHLRQAAGRLKSAGLLRRRTRIRKFRFVASIDKI
jgi:hypothetical protein